MGYKQYSIEEDYPCQNKQEESYETLSRLNCLPELDFLDL